MSLVVCPFCTASVPGDAGTVDIIYPIHKVSRFGYTKLGKQRFRCNSCRKTFSIDAAYTSVQSARSISEALYNAYYYYGYSKEYLSKLLNLTSTQVHSSIQAHKAYLKKNLLPYHEGIDIYLSPTGKRLPTPWIDKRKEARRVFLRKLDTEKNGLPTFIELAKPTKQKEIYTAFRINKSSNKAVMLPMNSSRIGSFDDPPRTLKQLKNTLEVEFPDGMVAPPPPDK